MDILSLGGNDHFNLLKYPQRVLSSPPRQFPCQLVNINDRHYKEWRINQPFTEPSYPPVFLPYPYLNITIDLPDRQYYKVSETCTLTITWYNNQANTLPANDMEGDIYDTLVSPVEIQPLERPQLLPNIPVSFPVWHRTVTREDLTNRRIFLQIKTTLIYEVQIPVGSATTYPFEIKLIGGI